MKTLCQNVSNICSNKKIIRMIVLCYLLFMAFMISMQSPMNPFHVTLAGVDSSVFHYVASVMKHGGAIYRDTFDHKGPLLYFINYLGLSISYYSGAWLIEFIALCISNLAAYKTARLFCRKIPACFVIFLNSTALLLCFFGGNFPECYALPCITISLYLFTDYFLNQKIDIRRLILCGMLFACAFMLKPNTISVWIAFCIGVFIQKILQKDVRSLLSFIGWFFLGFLIVIVPVFLYLIKMDIVKEFFETYFLFNFQYSGDAGLSASFLSALKCLSKELVFPCLLIACFLAFQKREPLYWRTFFIYYLLSVFLCSMSGTDYIYYRISLIPAYTVPLAAFFGRMDYSRKQIYPLLSMMLLAAAVFAQQWTAPTIHALSALRHTTAEIDLGDEHHRELFRLIEKYTDETDPFLVYGNEDAFYFYSHRMAVSKYSFQYPIILINEDIRNRFFQELDEKLPKLILVQSLWCNDEYIQKFLNTHPYRCITDFDDYALYLLDDTQ